MNTNTKTDYCVVINTFPLLIREYQNNRVVTLKDVDKVHGRPAGTARKRFNDNKAHFIEGEDYYVLTQPSEIRTLGITRPQGGVPQKVILITESGYLMLVKSFTDDLAWDVQRQLVNTYFKSKYEIQSTAQFHGEILELKSELQRIKEQIKDNKPTPPNYWLWKKHTANPFIGSLSEKLKADTRTTYDLVYDRMFAEYGFDRSFAISQYCVKYGVDNVAVIDAIADNPTYQQWFVFSIRKMCAEVQ